eukprot:COSAG04_NODE_380_length_15462_cov_2.388401_9_plen_186_part_00
MIDPPPLMEVLEAIFGTKDFCSTGAGGGDYNSECATVALPAILSTRSSDATVAANSAGGESSSPRPVADLIVSLSLFLPSACLLPAPLTAGLRARFQSVEYQNLHSVSDTCTCIRCRESLGVSSIHNHALCPRQDGGGHPDGPWFKDTKLEYHNDGNRKLVALDAPEDPELRYQTCDPASSRAHF